MTGAATNGLAMSPEAMRRSGRKATEILVDRISRLGDGNAWDGEFRQVLEEQFLKAPPEEGRPAEEVMDQVVRDVLPFAARLDHPGSSASFRLLPPGPACWPTSWPFVINALPPGAPDSKDCW